MEPDPFHRLGPMSSQAVERGCIWYYRRLGIVDLLGLGNLDQVAAVDGGSLQVVVVLVPEDSRPGRVNLQAQEGKEAAH